MSACSAQAESQVGCRLMVASSAKISRPRFPCVGAGPSARTRSMKDSISGREAAGAGGVWERSLLMAAVYTDSRRVGGMALGPRLRGDERRMDGDGGKASDDVV